MRKTLIVLCLLASLTPTAMNGQAMADEQAPVADENLWLEDVEGKEALAYVKGLNAASLPHLEAMPGFEDDRLAILAQLNAPDRLTYGAFRAGMVYNFWQDETNIRGLIRRASVKSYVSGAPAWETVLDIDALSAEEKANWVYKGMTCLKPDETRCMISLSPGGTDAVELREFDLTEKAFVQDGFVIPTAKTWFDWVDADTLIVGTDFGEGSMTESGYPRTQRLWKRGTKLAEAPELHAVPRASMGLQPTTAVKNGKKRVYIQDLTSFWTSDLFVVEDNKPRKLPLPDDLRYVGFEPDAAYALARTAVEAGAASIPSGSLLKITLGTAAELKSPVFETIFTPTENQSIDGAYFAGDAIYLSLLEDVNGTLLRVTQSDAGWLATQIALPRNGALNVIDADTGSDRLFVTAESFLTPETLFYVSEGGVKPVAALPARFDADGFETEQRFAISADGTKVPYYLVRAKQTQPPSLEKVPVWINAYGGFEIANTPYYLPAQYQRWLDGGGAFVLANIRGGGEYGPRWHQAALLKNRHKAFEDMAGIADDLVKAGITTYAQIGMRGGSNGGLLTGVMLTRYPDKHNGVIIGVPLLDMMRYDKLLAGASWTGEYGDPDDEDMRGYIERYSPYQNISGDKSYPEAFVYTSTKDDRVHPGHARKFAARLAQNKQPFLYYENIEGGHAGAANRKQAAYRAALELAFMKRRLMPN